MAGRVGATTLRRWPFRARASIGPGPASTVATVHNISSKTAMQLTAVRLFVRDIAQARDFYAQALGLPLRSDGTQHGYCVFAAGPASLVVEAVAPEAPADDQALVGRFTGLSFAVTDIQARYQELTARGVPFCAAPEVQAWGGITATFKDPAGNELQLAQYPDA